jgi:hypothetical protein
MGWVASEGPRDTRTIDQNAWTNLEKAGRDEGVSAVAETELGEVQNWGSLAIDLGRFLVAGFVMIQQSSRRGQFILSESGGREFERRRAEAAGTRSY